MLIYYSKICTSQEITSTVFTVRGRVHAWLFDSIDKTLNIVTVLPLKVTRNPLWDNFFLPFTKYFSC